MHFGVKQLSVKLHIYIYIYIGSLHPYMCMKSCRISVLLPILPIATTGIYVCIVLY